MTEEMLKLAREWWGNSGPEDIGNVQSLAALLTEARVEEAKWWQENDHDPIYLRDPKHSCPGCKRVIALEAESRSLGGTTK